MCFKLFWYKVFVHCKSKLLNFLVDFVLKPNKKSEAYIRGGEGRGAFHQRSFLFTIRWAYNLGGGGVLTSSSLRI